MKSQTGRRAPLSRERIATEALRVIDEAGLEGLSMRALGQALGVEAMALYHHFPGKGQLLDAVAELLLAGCECPGPEAGAFPERLRLTLRSYRAVALRHPHAFPLLTMRRAQTPRALAFFDRIVGLYIEAGFEPAMAARLFRLAGYFVGGAGLAEIASRAQAPDATRPVLEEAAPPDLPNLTAAAPHLRVANLDAIFEFGLEAIVEATCRAPRRLPAPPLTAASATKRARGKSRGRRP